MRFPVVNCPKCYEGRLSHFNHVERGVCFLCGGTAQVTEKVAGRWLARQMREDGQGPGTSSLPADRREWQTLELGEFGSVRIAKADRPNEFDLEVPSEVGSLPMSVSLHRGKVRPIPATVCNGLLQKAGRIAELLTLRHQAREKKS